MKALSRGIIVLVVALVILNIASASYAQSMASKLNRGLINIATGWFEIPKNMSAATAKHDFVSAFFIGLPKGCWMAIVRTGAGVYDTVTFPVPMPKDYNPILEPEFAFTDK
ncbi:MAG: exosortase system-associated protein, TIGR04073 family [Candidatus Omnitrophota bacterium]|nr:exosortase system-associated protein, TIGR04073 family [Candidatus Omnitrophota bacterium]